MRPPAFAVTVADVEDVSVVRASPSAFVWTIADDNDPMSVENVTGILGILPPLAFCTVAVIVAEPAAGCTPSDMVAGSVDDTLGMIVGSVGV